MKPWWVRRSEWITYAILAALLLFTLWTALRR